MELIIKGSTEEIVDTIRLLGAGKKVEVSGPLYNPMYSGGVMLTTEPSCGSSACSASHSAVMGEGGRG